MVVEHQPLDLRADNAVQIQMLPLEVVYNPAVIKNVLSFVETDNELVALRAVAASTIEGITSQTRLGLEFAIEEHKTLDLMVGISAPIFIFPEKYKT